MDSCPFENNLKRTINCPATRANMNEPSAQQDCGAGANFDGWSRGEKLLDGGAGDEAWNLGSRSTEILALPAVKTRGNDRAFTFWMEWLCYSCLSVFATAKWFLNTRFVFWKIPDTIQMCYAAITAKPLYAPF